MGMGGTKGGTGANGSPGSAGTTDGQEIDSTGGSISQQSLQLVITNPPPGTVSVVVAGADFGLTVAVETGTGNVVTSYDGPVSVQLSSNPGAATLGGTLTVAASNGIATFSGLSINNAGNGYALEAVSGGVTSIPDPINVTSTSEHGPVVIPIQVVGVPTLTQTKKGISAISVGYNQAVNTASATELGLYRVLVGVKKKHKLVYADPLKIKLVSESSGTNSVTIKLAKPYKGKVELTIVGSIEAIDGALSELDYSALV